MAVVLGLWSIILEPGKTHSVNIAPGIQITNVAFGPEIKGKERTFVTVKYPEFEQDDDEDDEDDEDEDDEDGEDGDIKLPNLITKEAVIAILKPEFVEQVTVNITLVEDVEVVEFSITGPNAVHLVGHYVRQEDFDQDPYSDEEEYDSDDEEIDSELEESMMEGLSGMNDEDDEDEERFREVIEEEEKKAAAAKAKLSTSDSTSTLTSIPIVIPPSAPTTSSNDDAAKPNSNSNSSTTFPPPATNSTALPPTTVPPSDSTTPNESTTCKKSKSKNRNPKKRAAEEDEDVAASLLKADAGDESMSSTLSKNQKKKLAKKQKVETAPVEEKKVEKKAAVAEKPAKKATESQTLPGGLVITDSKKGDGPVAKSGKKVGMRYIGKLENGKIFDSNTKGSPLSFTLGRGEVISGWDKGIVGMAVGGERKLVIPASMAYGKKGTQGIPGNATLHFDVKLVSLK